MRQYAGSPAPMDFSAWFEVFLEGKWYPSALGITFHALVTSSSRVDGMLQMLQSRPNSGMRHFRHYGGIRFAEL
jgi:hypothetical protein